MVQHKFYAIKLVGSENLGWAVNNGIVEKQGWLHGMNRWAGLMGWDPLLKLLQVSILSGKLLEQNRLFSSFPQRFYVFTADKYWYYDSWQDTGVALGIHMAPYFNEKVQCKFLRENIYCVYLLEAPHRGASNEHHNICFHVKINKIFTWILILFVLTN